MKVSVRLKSDWEEVVDSARVTIWKGSLGKEPSVEFKKRMIISEHSPLRELAFVVDIEGVKSWVATHFVRHHIGVEKYVSTQRDDRINKAVERDNRGQGELVNMRLSLNAQALINISKERLCHQASIDTQLVWRSVLRGVGEIDKELAQACVPKCIYRGFCPEGSQAKQNCRYSDKALATMRNTYLSRFCEKGCYING